MLLRVLAYEFNLLGDLVIFFKGGVVKHASPTMENHLIPNNGGVMRKNHCF